MARHRRQTKRRTNNKHRRSSRKMRGGVGEDDRQALLDLGFTEADINYLLQNNPRMSVEIFRNAINPPTSSPFYNEKQTAEEMMESIRKNNESINESEAFETPPKPSKRPRIRTMSEENDYEPDNSGTPNNLSGSFGGKRKSKRRTSNKNRRSSRKMRRNRRQQGGKGFTTEEEINPLAYIEQREISEANMPRP
jgi:hypothetical protein